MPIKTGNTAGEQEKKVMEIVFYLRILRKKGNYFTLYKDSIHASEEKPEGWRRLWDTDWPFWCKQNIHATQNIVNSNDHKRIQSEMQQHDKLYFHSYFQLWGFPDSNVICLFNDTQYISLSITCPVSPVTHAKFLYLKHISERKIPMCCLWRCPLEVSFYGLFFLNWKKWRCRSSDLNICVSSTLLFSPTLNKRMLLQNLHKMTTELKS